MSDVSSADRPFPCPCSPHQAAAYKAEANKAFAAKDFSKATELYSKAIELDASNHVLYSNRSASRSGERNYAGALEDAEKVSLATKTRTWIRWM
jgi:tetratricopeptide (TPR) repeat protein